MKLKTVELAFSSSNARAWCRRGHPYACRMRVRRIFTFARGVKRLTVEYHDRPGVDRIKLEALECGGVRIDDGGTTGAYLSLWRDVKRLSGRRGFVYFEVWYEEGAA